MSHCHGRLEDAVQPRFFDWQMAIHSSCQRSVKTMEGEGGSLVLADVGALFFLLRVLVTISFVQMPSWLNISSMMSMLVWAGTSSLA